MRINTSRKIPTTVIFIERMYDLKERILNLVYPRRCPICEEVVATKDGLIHTKCKEQLTYINEPRCMRCGKAIVKEEQEYCFDCTNRTFHYTQGFPCFQYDECMRKSIAAFKYKGKKEYADFYVEQILHRYEQQLVDRGIHLVVPIPIHAAKLRERGFNQAELIARGIATRLKVPMDPTMLVRTRKTQPQKALDPKQRMENLSEAFAVSRNVNQWIGKSILLVDDIYTTGSTMEACARLFVHAGVTSVYYTAVCIGHGY